MIAIHYVVQFQCLEVLMYELVGDGRELVQEELIRKGFAVPKDDAIMVQVPSSSLVVQAPNTDELQASPTCVSACFHSSVGQSRQN